MHDGARMRYEGREEVDYDGERREVMKCCKVDSDTPVTHPENRQSALSARQDEGPVKVVTDRPPHDPEKFTTPWDALVFIRRDDLTVE